MGQLTLALVFDAPQPGTKHCSRCDQIKPHSEFNKRKRSKDGYQAWCRECESANHRQSYLADPQAWAERGKLWRAANPERAREISRRSNAARPEARRMSSRRWRARNPEKVREQFIRWSTQNREAYLARQRQRRRLNREPFREYARQRRDWLRSNGQYEEFTRVEIGERDGWVCGICSDLIDVKLQWPDPMSTSIDHVIPLSLGGSHTRANCRIAHLICNMRRGNRVTSTLEAEDDPLTGQVRAPGAGPEQAVNPARRSVDRHAARDAG